MMNASKFLLIIFLMFVVLNIAKTQIHSKNDSLRLIFEDRNDSALIKLTAEKKIKPNLKADSKLRMDSLIKVRDNLNLSPKARIKAQHAIVFTTLYRDTKYCLPDVQKYIELSKQFQDSSKTMGQALGFLGFYYQHKEEFDSAKIAFEQALEYNIKHSKMVHILNAKIDLAVLEEKRGNYDAALTAYLTILDSCLLHKERTPEARCRINIGMIYNIKGDYIAALNQLEQALDLCKIGNLVGYMASTYLSLGTVNHAVGEFALAEDYFIKAIKWSDLRENTSTKRLSLIQYIKLKTEQKDYKEAVGLTHDLILFEATYGNENHAAEVFSIMGDIFLKSNQIDSAKYYINQSINIYKKLEFPEKSYRAYGIAGLIYLQAGDVTLAESFCKKAYQLNGSKGDAESKKSNCYCLYQVYKQSNNTQLALKYFEEYNTLTDKLADKEAAKKIVKIQLNNRFANKQFRDSLQNQRAIDKLDLEHNQRLESRTRLVWSLLIGLACLVFITIILWYAFSQNKRQKNELAKLNQLNKQIFSIISHDFRSPLMAMNMMVETLGDTNLDAGRFQFYLKDIKNQIAQTTNILDNLLNWATAELQIDIRKHFETYLNQIVQESEQAFATKLLEKQIQLVSQIPKDIILDIHPDLLRIVIRNLLGNAIKYSYPKSVINLSYDIHSKQIIVKDTGLGMDEKQVAVLFTQPVFSQLGANLETGFGIGLYITHELLRKIGWSINVQSEKGKGTTFYVNSK